MGICLPPSGCSAGKDQTVISDRKSDLLGIYMAIEPAKLCRQHISKYSRCQPGSVGINKEEKGLIRKKGSTQLDQGMDRFLDLPYFSFGTTAIRGRIHDNGIVMIAPSDLTLYKLYTVINYPAYRLVNKS